MSNDVVFNTKNYTDIQGLAQIKQQSKNNPNLANREVSQQFESLLVQMLLKSMRSSSKVFNSSEESNDQMDLYQDLFDKQISLSMSTNGTGIATNIEDYLKKITPAAAESKPENNQEKLMIEEIKRPTQIVNVPESRDNTVKETKANGFKDELDFVKSLWGHAKEAASLIGLDPKLLLAQAALETGWGKRVISDQSQGSSHNLFNIKADRSWDKEYSTKETLEQKDGLLLKENSKFRVYDSYHDSFHDYVNFIKTNPRYADALKEVKNPDQYIQLLQKANFATDSEYSNKIMRIYNSDKLNELVKTSNLI